MARAMRPPVAIQVTQPPEVAMRMVKEGLRRPAPCGGVAIDKHVEILMAGRERRFFSPWLSLEVEPQGAGSLFRGRFHPHPNIWTMFLAGYAATSITALFGAIYGFAQWMLGSPPWGLLSIPMGLLVLVLLYLASLHGQKLAAEQMDTMLDYFRDLVDGTLTPAPADDAS